MTRRGAGRRPHGAARAGLLDGYGEGIRTYYERSRKHAAPEVKLSRFHRCIGNVTSPGRAFGIPFGAPYLVAPQPLPHPSAHTYAAYAHQVRPSFQYNLHVDSRNRADGFRSRSIPTSHPHRRRGGRNRRPGARPRVHHIMPPGRRDACPARRPRRRSSPPDETGYTANVIYMIRLWQEKTGERRGK